MANTFDAFHLNDQMMDPYDHDSIVLQFVPCVTALSRHDTHLFQIKFLVISIQTLPLGPGPQVLPEMQLHATLSRQDNILNQLKILILANFI